MGGLQPKPSISKNEQSYKSAVGVEHRPEKSIFDVIMESGESCKDVPYAHNDTQEEKLRKVREELLRRIDSHTHADVTQLINTVDSQMKALSSKVELLWITVKTQAALIDDLMTANTRLVAEMDNVKEVYIDKFLTPSALVSRGEKLGLSINTVDISDILILQKYLLKTYTNSNGTYSLSICKNTKGWEKVIRENPNKPKSAQGVGKFVISEKYFINTAIPYFRKKQEYLDNLNKQFVEDGGGK